MTQGRNSKSPVVGVIAKVVRILELLKRSPSGLGLRTINQETRVNRSTAYRFLEHLVREDYLVRNPDGTYKIGLKLAEFGAYGDRASLREISEPVLRELWKSTQESVNLAVLDGASTLYLVALESPHEFRLAAKIGMRGPIHSSSLGKAIIAHRPADERDQVLQALKFHRFTANTITNVRAFKKELETTRRRGYSMDNEETYVGARAVGAPILNDKQEAVAAISVAGPNTRLNPNTMAALRNKVKEAAQMISARLVL